MVMLINKLYSIFSDMDYDRGENNVQQRGGGGGPPNKKPRGDRMSQAEFKRYLS